jgi:HEAT repeat protein
LARALKSPDVNLRRNVVLALNVLGGGWYFGDRQPPKIDISAALPMLIAALSDSDATVRGWAAEDIGDIGPRAAGAVPNLVALLSAPDAGVRNGACMGLRGIGPVAKSAVPALLWHALFDPDSDTRGFARFAVAGIL